MHTRYPIAHSPPPKFVHNPEYNGIYGPKQPLPDATPYIAANLLDKNNQRAVVRGGVTYFHLNKVLIMLLLFILPLNLGVYTTYKSIKGLYNLPIDGPIRRGMHYIEFEMHMVKSLYYRYQNNKTTLSSVINYHGKSIFLLSGLFFTLLLLLWPAPPPLIFDRQRRLVYTYHKSKLYITSFDAMPLLASVSKLEIEGRSHEYLRASNGLFLCTWKENSWQPYPFSIATHHYFGEPKLGYYAHRTWNWMIAYMDEGAHAVPEPVKGIGWLNILSPFSRKLPRDIETQVDQLLAKVGSIPGDTSLPSRYI